MSKIRGAILFALMARGWCVPRAFCQTETATISGRVTNRSGATVAGAEIHLENLEQVTVRTAHSNKDGIYAFSNVPPGPYRISVRKAGFRRVEGIDIVVNVQDRQEENIQLQARSIADYILARR